MRKLHSHSTNTMFPFGIQISRISKAKWNRFQMNSFSPYLSIDFRRHVPSPFFHRVAKHSPILETQSSFMSASNFDPNPCHQITICNPVRHNPYFFLASETKRNFDASAKCNARTQNKEGGAANNAISLSNSDRAHTIYDLRY